MKIDIRRYLSLRDSLLKEKNDLEVRLREINQALGQPGFERSTVSAGAPAQAAPAAGARGRRGRKRRGAISLREAVMQVASGTPLTKEEILQRVQAMGYRFSTKNPLNSLGVILYGKNPKFRNEGGRFSLPGGRPSNAAGSSAAAPAARGGRRKRRTMSPEARARIAAAQRARWAKARAGK